MHYPQWSGPASEALGRGVQRGLYARRDSNTRERQVGRALTPTEKRISAALWEEEVAEVFLQPDPAKPSYIELEVNPLGTMLDIYLLDVRKPLHYESWNSEKLQWSARVDGAVDGDGGDRTCAFGDRGF